jgi:hypothetical protein
MGRVSPLSPEAVAGWRVRHSARKSPPVHVLSIIFEAGKDLANFFNKFADQAGEPPAEAPQTTQKRMSLCHDRRGSRATGERADAFIAALRELIASTAVDSVR